jgi:outer membrane lipoprotein-sorting protein
MDMTVERVLEIADDSVALINDVNTNGASSVYLPEGLSQSEVNDVVQKNVDHLETVLAYDGSNPTKPDVAGSSADKSSYTAAITTGKNYITANS